MLGDHNYDALGGLTQVVYADQTIVYGYDQGTNGAGRLTSVVSPGASLAWSYDSHGRIVAREQTLGTVDLDGAAAIPRPSS